MKNRETTKERGKQKRRREKKENLRKRRKKGQKDGRKEKKEKGRKKGQKDRKEKQRERKKRKVRKGCFPILGGATKKYRKIDQLVLRLVASCVTVVVQLQKGQYELAGP